MLFVGGRGLVGELAHATVEQFASALEACSKGARGHLQAMREVDDGQLVPVDHQQQHLRLFGKAGKRPQHEGMLLGPRDEGGQSGSLGLLKIQAWVVAKGGAQVHRQLTPRDAHEVASERLRAADVLRAFDTGGEGPLGKIFGNPARVELEVAENRTVVAPQQPLTRPAFPRTPSLEELGVGRRRRHCATLPRPATAGNERVANHAGDQEPGSYRDEHAPRRRQVPYPDRAGFVGSLWRRARARESDP